MILAVRFLLIIIKRKNIQDGCDLPEHEELFLLNTKSYEPTALEKLKDIITLGGLYDNYPKVISEKFTENRVKMITKKLMDATNISISKEQISYLFR